VVSKTSLNLNNKRIESLCQSPWPWPCLQQNTMDSLQIPDSSSSIPGPSRQNGLPRPASVSPPTLPPQPSSRKRASHSVTASSHPDEQHQLQQQQPPYRDIDIYSHPAAAQYAASHPRRAIPKFGPYLLLQTLGEGEFGKVKLGLHTSWAEEVAVKLIKRHNIDSALRLSKVEREIEVLRVRFSPFLLFFLPYPTNIYQDAQAP
jgi:protein-serine/threonine kinase